MKKTRKKSKKNILFFLMLLILILSAIFMFIKLQKKIGYAYQIKFFQPHIPNKEEIIEAVHSIPQNYLEGIYAIEIVDMPLYYEGLYIVGGKIRLNVKSGFNQQILLHELKHHYCWQKEKYLGHEGCFKEPPLVIRQPVKDRIIIEEVTEEKQPSCFDNIKNQNEIEIDCGGTCKPCQKETIEILTPPKTQIWKYLLISFLILTIFISIISFYRKRNR